jgi:hypothetical protein
VREANFYDEKFGGAGPYAIEANYEGLLRLLEHAFGAVTTTVSEAAIRWQHAFTLATGELMTGKGISFHVHRDMANAFRLLGGKIRELRYTLDPKRNVQLEFDLVGKDIDTLAAVAPTLPGTSLYVAGHQAVIEIDDVARAVDSLELVFSNGLDDDKRVIGSKNIAEPVRGDSRRSVTGTLVADAADADWTKFNAGTLFKLEALSTGPTLGAGNYRLDIIALKCLVTEEPFQVTGPGLVKATIPFTVVKPTSGSMLDLTVQNAESVVA